MRGKMIIQSVVMAVATSVATAFAADYTRGIIWVNEDWYGH